jgi:hypothetical protein
LILSAATKAYQRGIKNVSRHPAGKIEPTGTIRNGIAMTEENKNPNNRVDASTNGKFHAFWNGRVVFENGRVKRFETEGEAWEFLARCDMAGKIIH